MLYNLRFWLISGIFATLGFVADGLCSTPFSQYGMIQNVRDYSSNPFYNSTTATITTPKIISANGPDLKAKDCQSVVQGLIEYECATRNRCQNTKLTDIRPSLMIQLSSLPEYNYATTCSGYIDYFFEEYKKNNQSAQYIIPQYGAAFPIAPGVITTQTTTNNNIPQWRAEYNERADELRSLQQATNTTSYVIDKQGFPVIFEDLPFEERNQIKQQGYEPYKDAKVYVPLNIKIDTEAAKRIAQSETDIQECMQKGRAAILGLKEKLKAACEDALLRAERESSTITDSELNRIAEATERLEREYQKAKANENDLYCTCSDNSPARQQFLNHMKVICDSDNPRKFKSKKNASE